MKKKQFLALALSVVMAGGMLAGCGSSNGSSSSSKGDAKDEVVTLKWIQVGNGMPKDYGNYIEGDVITVNTQRSIICGQKKLIAAVGVENLIVIDTEDATLICAKDSTQDVKKVIENLRICNRDALL